MLDVIIININNVFNGIKYLGVNQMLCTNVLIIHLNERIVNFTQLVFCLM